MTTTQNFRSLILLVMHAFKTFGQMSHIGLMSHIDFMIRGKHFASGVWVGSKIEVKMFISAHSPLLSFILRAPALWLNT